MDIKPLLLTLLLGCQTPTWATTNDTPADGYTATRYPIVLVHGLFGFNTLAGVDYWYGIPSALSEGGAKVFVVALSSTESTEVRGEQLLSQVDEILALTGASKVNLIGHSQGSPTSRYVAAIAPEKIASVTSVGGVNWGSTVADVLRGLAPEGSLSEAVVQAAVNGLAGVIEFLSGTPSDPRDATAALDSLSTQGTLAFNQRYPEGMPTEYCGQTQALADNGVYYFSWSGGNSVTNLLDPVDSGLAATGLLFDEPSDGMVASCSSHLGQVLKDDYHMNHLDEVNQTFGLVSLSETNPVTLYRQQANRLKNLGL